MPTLELPRARAEHWQENCRRRCRPAVKPERPIEGDGDDQGGESHHEKDVENIAAHDITHGNIRISLPGSGDGGEQLRQRGPQGHDGQADEPLAHPQQSGNGAGRVHRHAAPQHNGPQSNGGQQQDFPQAPLSGRLLFLGLAFGSDQQVGQIGGKENGQYQSVQKADDAVPALEQQQQADSHQKGHLPPHGTPLHRKRRDDGGQTQNNQDIQDIAAHNVADGDLRAPLQGGGYAHRRLRRTGPHRHNGQADNQRRDFQFRRDLRRSIHKPVRALYQKDEPHRQQSQLNQHFHYKIPPSNSGKAQKTRLCRFITAKSRHFITKPDFENRTDGQVNTERSVQATPFVRAVYTSRRGFVNTNFVSGFMWPPGTTPSDRPSGL